MENCLDFLRVIDLVDVFRQMQVGCVLVKELVTHLVIVLVIHLVIH